MNVFVVVDMQNDFVDTNVLGTPEGEVAVDNARTFLWDNVSEGDFLLFTQDTHDNKEEYLKTQEGRLLPVPHCEELTDGWAIHDTLINCMEFLPTHVAVQMVSKYTFGSTDLVEIIESLHQTEGVDSITLMGICTDICVVTNAALLKSSVQLSEVPVQVVANACAGVTPELHEQALNVMSSFQVKII